MFTTRFGAILTILVACAAVHAQAPSKQISPDEIEAEISELAPLEEADELDDEQRTRLELCRDAIASLQAARRSAERAADLAEQLAQVPVELEAVRAELDLVPPDPTPDVGPDPALADLEDGLQSAKSDLEASRGRLSAIEAELAGRNERSTEISDQIATAQHDLEALAAREAALPLPDESPELTWARRVEAQAAREALDEQLNLLKTQRGLSEARSELLPLLRERWVQRVDNLEASEAAWQKLVDDARAAESAQLREEAARSAALAHPVVTPLADANVLLAKRRDTLQPRLEQAQNDLQGLRPDPEVLERLFDRLKRKVDIVGMTNRVGLLLRKSRNSLPDAVVLRKRIQSRRIEMADLEFEHLELEELRETLVADREAMIETALAGLGPDVPGAKRMAIDAEFREQLQLRRDYLDGLDEDLTTLFDRLNAINIKEQEVVDLTEQLVAYIDEHILWMQSTDALGFDDIMEAGGAIAWLFSPTEWERLTASLQDQTKARPTLVALVAMAVLLLLLARPRLGRRISAIGADLTASGDGTLLQFTAVAAFTVLRAACLPAVLWAIAAWLNAANHDIQVMLSEALAGTLQRLGGVLFVLMLAWETAMPQGLGEAHFGWRQRNMQILRRELGWLMIVIAVLSIPGGIVNRNEAFESSLGRMALILSMVVLSVFVYRLLNPRTGIVREQLAGSKGWVTKLRYVWYPVTVLIPLVIAVLSAMGYHYTATQMTKETTNSAMLVVFVVFGFYFARRWVFVGKRRMALEQARRLREAHEERAARGEDAGAPPAEEQEIDLAAMSEQALRLLRIGVLFTLLIGFFAIWSASMPAIGVLERVELWQGVEVIAGSAAAGTGAETTAPVYAMITLQDLLWALVLVVITMIVAKNVPGLLEITVLQHLPLERGSQFAIATLVRYSITIVGMVVAFRVIGITWMKVQWLAAALTVGLGFGLNEIFGNFIAGLIILFERPIRVGDTVTVANITGTISEIKIRATTLRDWDRKELVIPNKTFVIDTITNWTLTDPILRLVFPVVLEHGADMDAAERCLLDVARRHPHVLDDPAPSVMFTKVGENGLEIDLRLFIPHMDHFVSVKHEVHAAIVEAFREAGVGLFSFSHRDVQMRSLAGEVPLQIRDEPGLGRTGA